MAGRANCRSRVDLGGREWPERRSVLGRGGSVPAGHRNNSIRHGRARRLDAFDRALANTPGLALGPRVARLRPCSGCARLSGQGALADCSGPRLRPPLPREGGPVRSGRSGRHRTRRPRPFASSVRPPCLPCRLSSVVRSVVSRTSQRCVTGPAISGPQSRILGDPAFPRAGVRSTSSRVPGRWRRSGRTTDAARSWERLSRIDRQPHPSGIGEMASNLARRVAITGAGVIGSFGLGTRALWKAFGTGGAHFAPCTRYRSTLPSAEAVKPDLRRMLRSGQTSRMSLVSQFAIAAVHLALDQAGIHGGKSGAGDAIGIVFGTSHGPAATTQEIYDDLIDRGPSAVKPRAFQESVFNAPASLASISVRTQGSDTGPGRQRVRSRGTSAGTDAARTPRCRCGDRALRGRAVRGRPVGPEDSEMASAGRRGRTDRGPHRRDEARSRRKVRRH